MFRITTSVFIQQNISWLQAFLTLYDYDHLFENVNKQ